MRYDLLARIAQWVTLAAIILYTLYTPGIDCGLVSYVRQEVVSFGSNPLISD